MDKVAMYKDYIEKTAGVKFKDLKKNEVKLTPEERKQVMESGAVWGSSPAVWKSVDKDGKVTFVTNTHRAFNTAPTVKGAIGRFHKFIKSTASENTDDSIEKIAKEQTLYHASPVQDIKRFRKSEDTSGNNKGKVIFGTKYPEFAAAFGTRWHDGIAMHNVETKNAKVPTENNFVDSVLKYTDKVNVDAPCSMYRIKGDFKPLRYSDDLEQVTSGDVEVISEEKFKNFKDMAKAYDLKLKSVSENHILNKLKSKKSSVFEKTAEQKIPELEEAFSDPIEKKVAYMIATSHEYKKPNVNAALSFVKNYKWELTKEKVKNLQGIEKPVDEVKVADMAKNMKHVEPFIVVNQLHGIRPQTPGKKLLIDGHHRKKACEAQNREEVPVYKGTYTGKAELPKSELKEKTAYHIINDAFEKLAFDKSKTYAVDFDGTIVTNAFPRIGTINQNMVQFMRKVKDKGGKNIVWTCRSGKYLDEAKKFLKDNDIPFDSINSNPDKDFGSRKIYADYYVDDRAINIKDITKTASLLTHKDLVTNTPNKNITLLTGYSGSGKTTLIKKLAKESPNNIHVSIDDFFDYDPGANDIASEFVRKNGIVTDKNSSYMLPKILKHIENESRNNPNNHYYIEGITLLDNPSLFKQYPSIIKGTGLLKSSYQKSKRGNMNLVESLKFNNRLSKDIDDTKKKLQTKTAYEIIDEAFEKIAAQKKDRSQAHINKIMKSGERQTMLHITYTDKKGDTTGRLVEPYKLSGDSFWGFDPAKEGIRRFKVGQINGTKLTKVKFDPRWPIETSGHELPKKEGPSGQLHLMDIVKK